VEPTRTAAANSPPLPSSLLSLRCFDDFVRPLGELHGSLLPAGGFAEDQEGGQRFPLDAQRDEDFLHPLRQGHDLPGMTLLEMKHREIQAGEGGIVGEAWRTTMGSTWSRPTSPRCSAGIQPSRAM
jgi:hypothetical protein